LLHCDDESKARKTTEETHRTGGFTTARGEKKKLICNEFRYFQYERQT
jgi:hypothetical protein